MDNTEEIKRLVDRYTESIRTQDKESFCSLWANNPHCILISIATEYKGLESIYQDFVIGVIQKAYSEIKLISDGLEIHLLNDNFATVIFHYHTECIKRDDGKPFGIKGMETQVHVKENGQWKIQHVHYSM
ncbi:hypothetical protein M9Y10_015362 [Tritrichomonas musculus]|uniref:Calcium/calmodulin-dependent protein kinase II association-domain domain-containing protein n=1 Tax=Tritrichomonas musculus TaxID=1915356 RepID=A0ABR2L235_9EUKA